MTAPPFLILSLVQSGIGEDGAIASAEGAMSLGVSIAIAGLMIVFLALIMMSLFIAALPKVVAMLETVLPEEEDHRSGVTEGHPESLVPDDAAVLAAIGFVLHTELQRHVSSVSGNEKG
jgi:oxaloacetate decarboxylase gamma subunit